MKPACACEAKVEIRVSSVEEMRRHGATLFEAHYREVALNQNVTPLDPDWPAYYACEQAGLLHAVAAWHDGELAGYVVSFLVPKHLHYRGVCVLQNDLLFVADKYRGTTVCGRLMRETKAWGREHGASRVAWHCKEGSTLHRMLDKRKSCIVQDIIYTELL